MSDPAHAEAGTGLHGLVLRLCTAWAYAGGAVLLAVVLVNVASVVGVATVGSAFPGDFELTEIGAAVAAFAFLPYCQIRRLNVTADIFTARASRWWLSLFGLLASIVALLFATILAWRMWLGMLDQREYDYTTAILQIPIWWGFVPCLISLALLAAASAATLTEDLRRLRGR